MYYTSSTTTDNTTRLVGIGVTVVSVAFIAWVLANGLGKVIVEKITKTEVVIVDTPVIEEEEPPPPPPVDVELPPPPPQVVLPEFRVDLPPPPNAIQQVEQVARPANPPPVAKPPPAPPAAVMAQRPKPGRRFTLADPANYPAASARAKEEGIVTASMCVDTEGRITNVKIVRPSGFPRLDEATLEKLPRQRLDPAKDQFGKPMAVCPYSMDIQWQLPK